MVVHEIDIERIAGIEPKDDPPVRPHGDCPEAAQVALERMQAESVYIQILSPQCCVQRGQDQPDTLDMLGRDATRIIVLVEPSQTPVAEARNYRGLRKM
jgi:hypothetical protein